MGAMEDCPHRFGVLQRRLEGVSPKVLTQTLRRLEEAGFVHREIFAEVPLHVEYGLTELGHSVSEPLAGLRSWVESNLDRISVL
jgi:DNA-binding HxlR family transcriptional regulator